MKKLKWTVAPAPTGRFRSFDKRGWPSAMYENEKPAVHITCPDAYHPADAKIGLHSLLSVRIAKWANPRLPDQSAFEWKTLAVQFPTLALAKAAAQNFIDGHPEYWPQEQV